MSQTAVKSDKEVIPDKNTGDQWTYVKQIEDLEQLLRKKDEHIASQERAMKQLNEQLVNQITLLNKMQLAINAQKELDLPYKISLHELKTEKKGKKFDKKFTEWFRRTVVDGFASLHDIVEFNNFLYTEVEHEREGDWMIGIYPVESTSHYSLPYDSEECIKLVFHQNGCQYEIFAALVN